MEEISYRELILDLESALDQMSLCADYDTKKEPIQWLADLATFLDFDPEIVEQIRELGE